MKDKIIFLSFLYVSLFVLFFYRLLRQNKYREVEHTALVLSVILKSFFIESEIVDAWLSSNFSANKTYNVLCMHNFQQS